VFFLSYCRHNPPTRSLYIPEGPWGSQLCQSFLFSHLIHDISPCTKCNCSGSLMLWHWMPPSSSIYSFSLIHVNIISEGTVLLTYCLYHEITSGFTVTFCNKLQSFAIPCSVSGRTITRLCWEFFFLHTCATVSTQWYCFFLSQKITFLWIFWKMFRVSPCCLCDVCTHLMKLAY
jgi:hypothetical protein